MLGAREGRPPGALVLALAALAIALGFPSLHGRIDDMLPGDASSEAASSGALGADSAPLPSRYRDYADCLWPLARNHGFFEVQMQALRGGAHRALWTDFVASVGADACAGGSADIVADMPSLERALRDTHEAARRHFAAP